MKFNNAINIILFLMLFIFSAIANALNIEIIDTQNDKQTLLIEGNLEFPKSGVFPGLNNLEHHKDIDLILDSSGGKVLAAIRLNEQLNNICPKDECLIRAIVRQGNACLSACTILFFNAHAFELNEGSRLGIHGISLVKRNPFTGEVLDIKSMSAIQAFTVLHRWGFPLRLLSVVGLQAFRTNAITEITPKMLAQE